MATYNYFYDWFNIRCELHGGDGLDYLSGGILDDVLVGGLDGCLDVLIGNEGADLFVECSEWRKSTWRTYKYVEKEYVVDKDSAEGDLLLLDSELAAAAADSDTSQSSESSVILLTPDSSYSTPLFRF